MIGEHHGLGKGILKHTTLGGIARFVDRELTHASFIGVKPVAVAVAVVRSSVACGIVTTGLLYRRGDGDRNHP